MKSQYIMEKGCLVVYVPRELDHHQANRIRTETDLLIDTYHVRHLVFDFTETEFMDSSRDWGDHRAVQKLRLFRWGCECVPSERARGQDIYRIRVEKNHSGKRIGDSGGSKNEQSERDETDI